MVNKHVGTHKLIGNMHLKAYHRPYPKKKEKKVKIPLSLFFVIISFALCLVYSSVYPTYIYSNQAAPNISANTWIRSWCGLNKLFEVKIEFSLSKFTRMVNFRTKISIFFLTFFTPCYTPLIITCYVFFLIF